MFFILKTKHDIAVHALKTLIAQLRASLTVEHVFIDKQQAKIVELEARIDRQEKTLQRLRKVCDEFYLGHKAPWSLYAAYDTLEDGTPTGPALPYRELARRFKNQRDTLRAYHAQQDDKAIPQPIKTCTWFGQCQYAKEQP